MVRLSIRAGATVAEIIQGFNSVDKCCSDRETGSAKERAGVVKKSGRKAGERKPIPFSCWFCKSASSAAYFLPNALQRWMKPSVGTFLDLCGDALPGALVHVCAHRSFWRWVSEIPGRGREGGGWGGALQPHRTPPVTAWCSARRDASFTIHGWRSSEDCSQSVAPNTEPSRTPTPSLIW